MGRFDELDRAYATSTCRARLLGLLNKVDDLGSMPPADLMRQVETSVCVAGHDLHYAALNSVLVSGGDGLLRLNRSGEDLLLEAGRPSPNWAASVARGASALRTWQLEALEAWCDHGRHGVIEAVTGTGKSRVGIEATREALSNDYSVIIMVPTIDLVGQWVRALKQNLVPSVGTLGDGSRANLTTHRVIVGTVQSLYADPPTRTDGKVLLVADECHRYGAGQWSRALHPSYRRRLGLTATFERNDDGIHQLLDYFGGGPVYRIGFKRAIADGVVARYDVKLLGVPLDREERRDYDRADETARDARIQLLAADFPAEPFGAFLYEVQKAAEADPDPTISDLARRYLKAFSERIDIMTNASAKLEAARLLAPDIERSRGSILFTRRVDMSEEIASVLVESGVKAAAVHSETRRAQRQDLLTHLKIGRLKALVAPTILDEGLDVPDVDLGVVMGGSRSRRQMIQRMGRVLRLKPDGRKATFIVVYAEDTAEDITRTDGAEGCLDLIVESADAVTRLVEQDGGLRPDTAAVTPLQRPQVSSLHSTKPDAGSNPTRALPSTGAVAEFVDRLDPEAVALTKRVIDEYSSAHGADPSDAAPDLRRLLADFKTLAQAAWSTSTAGAAVLRHEGFELVVCEDRFIHYASHRRDALTWNDLRESQVPAGYEVIPDIAAGNHHRVPAETLERDGREEGADAAGRSFAVAAEAVVFDSRAVAGARGLFEAHLSFAETESRLRLLLAEDLTVAPAMTSSGRLVEFRGARGTWTIRGDGQVVHRFVRHDSDPDRPGRPRKPADSVSPARQAKKFTIESLESTPQLLGEFLDPRTVLVELRAIEKAARKLGLGDPGSDEALDAVRAILADDLADGPDITSAFGRLTIHGRRATWTLRVKDLRVIAISLTSRQTGSAMATTSEADPEGSDDGTAEPNDIPDPRPPASPLSDEVTPQPQPGGELGGQGAPASEPEPAAVVAAASSAVDLVSQFERLAALKERGYLTDEEFAAAKARIFT